MTADGLGEKARGRLLVALFCQQEIDGVVVLIHRAMQLAPLGVDLDVGLVEAPGGAHRPLSLPELVFRLWPRLEAPLSIGVWPAATPRSCTISSRWR
jgi:hypothetical protein